MAEITGEWKVRGKKGERKGTQGKAGVCRREEL
jgi:hypothetical protein